MIPYCNVKCLLMMPRAGLMMSRAGLMMPRAGLMMPRAGLMMLAGKSPEEEKGRLSPVGTYYHYYYLVLLLIIIIIIVIISETGEIRSTTNPPAGQTIPGHSPRCVAFSACERLQSCFSSSVLLTLNILILLDYYYYYQNPRDLQACT